MKSTARLLPKIIRFHLMAVIKIHVFYAGLGYNKSEGIVLGSDFQRISARVNIDQKITDWADFSVKQMIASTTQNGFRDQNDQAQGLGTSSPLGVLFALDPTAPIYKFGWNI